jgi:glycosyltransferase involved in cell wall biosynthesis
MKVCIIGKYPPIEGGVSTNTYWLARGLAQRGHQVHVVTNADEVEDMYRMSVGADDARWLEGSFDHGGAVHLHNPQAYSRAAMRHIPESNPFVSKLASVATDVIRQHGCEVILAYYYEPYGVAGWLASQWTGAPLLLKHAGSDLDRLMRQPDLSTVYKEILRRADAVVTRRGLIPRFLGFGVRREQFRGDVAYGLPREVFAPEGPRMDFSRLGFRIGDETELTSQTRRWEPPPSVSSAAALFNPQWPTIGIIGETKGTYDLIAALGKLAAEGLSFTLVAMVGEAQARVMTPAVVRAGLKERCVILPLLPNWRVPEFLRSCTAARLLERGFSVEIHGPVVPREILACGTCLVLSGEIASKQRYRDALVDGQNVLVVEDPRAIDTLVLRLRQVIQDPASARAIGARGAAITEARGDYDRYVQQWELLLAPFAQRARDTQRQAASASPDSSSATAAEEPIQPTLALQRLADILPDLVAYLRVRHPAIIVASLNQRPHAEPLEVARRLCSLAEEMLTQQKSAAHRALFSTLRYARAKLDVTCAPPLDAPPFALADALRGRVVDLATVGALFPLRGHAVRVESFEHDVSAVFSPTALPGRRVHTAAEVDAALAAAPERVTRVLFQRTANLSPCELQLDTTTETLLAACDGTRDTQTVLAAVADQLGLPPASRASAEGSMLAALAGLYGAGVIIFAERRPGGGWMGGTRLHGAPAACGGNVNGADRAAAPTP